jgi:hypothetical protein
MTFVIAVFFQALNPIPLTVIAALLLIWLFRRMEVLRKYRKHIVIVAAILYVIDFLFAIPRIHYAFSSPTQYEVLAKSKLPKDLVLVHLGCDRTCLNLFVSGKIETITRITAPSQPTENKTLTVVRYRAARREGDCDEKNFRFASLHFSRAEILEFQSKGFCPLAENVEVPKTGIFIVSSAYGGRIAVPFLLERPWGWNADYAATEVQERSPDAARLLARTRHVEMPGPIGPLVGYWEPRGDFATFPRGAKGWGFWRPIISRGDYHYLLNMKWIFEHVLPA